MAPWLIRRVLDWMIGFIDFFFYNHSYSQAITTAHNQWLFTIHSILAGLQLYSLLVFLLLLFPDFCLLLWLTCFRLVLGLLSNATPVDLRITSGLRRNYEWRITYEWMRFSLQGRFYSLAVTMENVCCLSVDKEARSIPSRSTGIYISIETCVNFAGTLWFPRVYNF
jgi:hypothetical protein